MTSNKRNHESTNPVFTNLMCCKMSFFMPKKKDNKNSCNRIRLFVLPFFDVTNRLKGQKISKANYCFLISYKKTNENENLIAAY